MSKNNPKKNQKEESDDYESMQEENEEEELELNEENENMEEEEIEEGEEMDEEKELNEEEEGEEEKELNGEEEEIKEDKLPIEKINMDMGEMNIRIQEIVDILSDFKNKKEENKTRNDYMIELKTLLMQYYDYNEDVTTLILNLFSPNEALEFMEANTTSKITSIRTNTLKTKRRELAKDLIQRNVNLDPLAEWTKVGLKIYSSTVPIGATPEYLAGHYMLQSASSFLPVLALNPQPEEKILDMCASPGGKTTYIAQLMKNTGILVANDLRKDRLKSLFFNIHRMGIKNSIITNYDGRQFKKLFNSFDRVLLDAPCSGLGVIAKDPSVKINRTYKEVLDNSRLQKELILTAIDSVNIKGKGEGTIVYSTCSIAVEENEWVVDYALKNRYVKCVETGLEIGEKGFTSFREKHFHQSLQNTRRIYPHIHNMDGFFVAKLKKYADGPKANSEEEMEEKERKIKYEKEEEENNEIEDEDRDDIFDNEEDELDDEDIIERGEEEEKNKSKGKSKKFKEEKINKDKKKKKKEYLKENIEEEEIEKEEPKNKKKKKIKEEIQDSEEENKNKKEKQKEMKMEKDNEDNMMRKSKKKNEKKKETEIEEEEPKIKEKTKKENKNSNKEKKKIEYENEEEDSDKKILNKKRKHSSDKVEEGEMTTEKKKKKKK